VPGGFDDDEFLIFKNPCRREPAGVFVFMLPPASAG
jgi:hypothetical protein